MGVWVSESNVNVCAVCVRECACVCVSKCVAVRDVRCVSVCRVSVCNLWGCWGVAMWVCECENVIRVNV